MTDSFAEAPVSVAEVRAERASDGSQWTPRDALVSLLRDIDRGKVKASDLIVCYAGRTDGGHTSTHYVAATSDALATNGLLARVMYLVNSG